MLRALIRITLLLAWLIVLYPPVFIAHHGRRNLARDWMIRLFYKGVLAICGIRLSVTSRLSDARPLMLVSNHVSYLDIPIINSIANICFTPKSEIASWPIVGGACRIAESIFIERSANALLKAKSAIERMLLSGRVVFLYPEATTGNGIDMLPFKSSFFTLAEEPIAGRELFIQPMALVYKRINEKPIAKEDWPRVAWYGDMVLLPHLWQFLQFKTLEVEIAFLNPVTIRGYGTRKALALHCQQDIAGYIARARSALK